MNMTLSYGSKNKHHYKLNKTKKRQNKRRRKNEKDILGVTVERI